jgi:integrase
MTTINPCKEWARRQRVLSALGYGSYGEYLQGQHWLAVQRRILAARATCEDCGSTQTPQLHHLTYDRLGGEQAILDWAKVHGLRQGENPAQWRGHLQHSLPAKLKVRRVKHHAALPYAELPDFIAKLRDQEGVAARALEFTILTAARTGDTIGALWDEVSTSERLWTVPPERMKAGKEHRVPLSARALAILNEAKCTRTLESQFVFPGGRRGKPLSNMAMATVLRRMGQDDITVHGFRSTFRDWAAERTNFPSEVVEMALAHTVGNKVEAAYRRGDLFEKRRRLMADWATYCSTPAASGREKVIPMRRSR